MFPFRLAYPTVALLCWLVFSTPACAQRGAITAPRNLAELTDRADLVVRGVVLSAKFEPHPELHNLNTVVITVKVKQTLKGTAPSLYTFRQFIWDIRDRYNTAGYRKGQDLLLMMNKPNSWGLTSPVGLEQGRFRVSRDAAGAQMAANGHANAGLFSGVQPVLQKRDARQAAASARTVRQTHGPVRVEELSQIIKALAGKN